MRLRTKYFLYTTIIITAVLTLAFGGLYLIMPTYYTYEKTKEVEQFAENVKKEVEKKEWSDDLAITLYKQSFAGNMSIQILDKQEKVFFSTEQTINGHQVSFSSVENSNVIIQSNGQTSLDTMGSEDRRSEYIIPNEGEGASVSVLSSTLRATMEKEPVFIRTYASIQPIDDAKKVLWALYPWTLILGTIIGGVGAFFYSWLSTRQIHSVIQATEQMQKIQGAQLIKVTGKDEISDLAQNINYLYTSLASTIKTLDKENKQVAELERSKAEFMRSASHELKTPLTAINSVLEGMIHHVGPYKDHEKYLAVCQQIVYEQEALINQILTLSKIDIVGVQEEKEAFRLQSIYEEHFFIYEVLAKEEKKVLEKEVEDFSIYGVKEDFIRIWNNLLSNALRYSSPNTAIRICGKNNQLTIFNQCEPLSEEELTRIFDPFYRPDYARNRENGGTGLGLYIVSQLAKRNDWTYTFVVSPDKKGMVFTLQFGKYLN